MPSDYNVDDILDEIRRKKRTERVGDDGRDTYQSEQGRARAAAPVRERTPTSSGRYPPPDAYEQPAPRRAERPAAFPGGRTSTRRAARTEDPGFAFGEPQPEPPRRAERPAYDAPERPRRAERPAYDAPERPRRAERPAYEAPERPRRAERPAYEAPEPPRRAERPAYDTPERPRMSERYDLDEPVSARTPVRYGFDEPVREQPRRVGYEDPDEPVDGFAFDVGEEPFALPRLDDEPPRRAARPRPGYSETGYTQEVDAPAVRAPRRGDTDSEMVQTKWKQSAAAQELLAQQQTAEDDFNSPEDRAFVEKDIRALRTGLHIRMGLTGVLFLASLYLTLSLKALPFSERLGLGETFLLPLLPAIAPENNLRLFVIVNLVVCLLAAIVCAGQIGSGLLAFCKLRADNDTPAALAMLGVLAHGIFLIVNPDGLIETAEMLEQGLSAPGMYFPAAVAVLLFSLLGKRMLIGRVERNFKFLVSDAEKHAFLQIRSRDFSREFTRGLGADVDRVAYTAKTGFLTGFLERSYSSDYSEQFARLVCPLVLLLAGVVAAVSGVLAKDVGAGFTAFAALLCVTAPFSGTILPQVMQARVAKRLTRQGGMLTGYEAAEEFSEVNAVILSDQELFFAENVKLHGMKVFAEKRIDEAILDAASVILSCEGIMSGVFLNMIGGNRRMLKQVDSLIYEDGMGLSAWVDGKRVLIGSQELMRGHGIDCPSRDFESRYVRDGRQVLYIANSGELSAMFVVSYNGDPAIRQQLQALERRGIALVVHTTDPNITAELVAMAFSLGRGKVRILPGKMQHEYQVLSQPKQKVSADGCHAGGLTGVTKLLASAAAVRASVTRASMVQLIGIIAGYGLVSFMAFTGSLSAASFGALIAFNLGWLCVSWLVAATAR